MLTSGARRAQRAEKEVGPDGINVNAVAPDAFPTDAEKIHPDPVGYDRRVLEQQAVKRRGTPDDVGNLVAFLAPDEASSPSARPSASTAVG